MPNLCEGRDAIPMTWDYMSEEERACTRSRTRPNGTSAERRSDGPSPRAGADKPRAAGYEAAHDAVIRDGRLRLFG